VLSRKLTQPAPSVRQSRESVPFDLDAVIARCLARSPADRYRNAMELVEALRSSPVGQSV
jgi:eukaryotic-like serine/threonine-protein kinase